MNKDPEFSKPLININKNPLFREPSPPRKPTSPAPKTERIRFPSFTRSFLKHVKLNDPAEMQVSWNSAFLFAMQLRYKSEADDAGVAFLQQAVPETQDVKQFMEDMVSIQSFLCLIAN